MLTWTLIVAKGRLRWRLGRLNRAFATPSGRNAISPRPRPSPAPTRTRWRASAAPGSTLRDLGKDGEHSLQFTGDRRDVIEASLRQQIQNEQHAIESGLTILASIGSTAPFVGLFGTVWGIMHALQDISRTGSASSTWAGPVGER